MLENNEAIEAGSKYLSSTIIVVIKDPYEPEALMRFTASVSLNGLSTKADTLIDIAASLNFVSKEFVMANVVYKDCKTDPNRAIRVASEQCISLRLKCFPLQFSLLVDMNSLTYNFEFLPISTVQILS